MSETTFDSMSGDRTSYINSDNLAIINTSPVVRHFDILLGLVVKLDNTNYNDENLRHRIDTLKKSLIHINDKSLSFTIFPHLEYDFNTERFDNSLREWKNFQYYVLYICIANLWKAVFNKVVHTCGTQGFVRLLYSKISKEEKDYVFSDIWDAIGDDIIPYFSIKIAGRTLTDQEKAIVKEHTSKQDSNNMISYLQSLCAEESHNENTQAIANIAELTGSIGHKPRVLIMIAYLETQTRYFLEKMMYHINAVKNESKDLLDIDYALDNDRVGKESGDYTPWSRVKRIRNLMINKYDIKKYDYLYIIDSDIIYYPHNFLLRAIGLNPQGITAPMALIENSVVFYDWCGYQKKNGTSLYGPYRSCFMNKSCQERNFQLSPPYVHDLSRLVEIDSVGCTYVVPAITFSQTYGSMKQELLDSFRIAKVGNHKINEDIVQYEDHPTFTDHFTVCAAVRANGNRILMDRGSPAYHADLPLHGEGWH